MPLPLSRVWQFRAASRLGVTLGAFRRLSKREQIGWQVFAELEFYEASPERIPAG